MLTHGITPVFPRGVHLFIPLTAIGSVPSLSGRAIAYRWRSPPRVRRLRASSPQGSSSNGCFLFRHPHHGPTIGTEDMLCDTESLGGIMGRFRWTTGVGYATLRCSVGNILLVLSCYYSALNSPIDRNCCRLSTQTSKPVSMGGDYGRVLFRAL